MTDNKTAHARLTKALSEPFPREEIDLDDVRSILATSQQSAQGGEVVATEIETFEDVKRIARKPYRNASPFRIGIVFGENNLSIPHPYVEGSRGFENFMQGVKFGRSAKKSAPAVPSAAKDPEDAEMLDFMIEHEAWVAWSRDRECCRVFSRDEEGNVAPMTKWGAGLNFDSGREAIRAAIAAANAGKDKGVA